MKPSIGRIVHYGENCDAALVVHVWSEHGVNLAVFDHNGSTLASKTSVLNSDGPKSNHWHWPERVE